jgi:hypothetical protein
LHVFSAFAALESVIVGMATATQRTKNVPSAYLERVALPKPSFGAYQRRRWEGGWRQTLAANASDLAAGFDGGAPSGYKTRAAEFLAARLDEGQIAGPAAEFGDAEFGLLRQAVLR